MLEPLAGRLKWERAGDGILVEVPAFTKRSSFRAALRQTFIYTAVLFFVVSAMNACESHFGRPSKPIAWSSVLFYFAAYFLASLLPKSRPRITLTLNPRELGIEWHSWLIGPPRATYSAAEVKNLKFVDATSDSKLHSGMGLSEIQFEYEYSTEFFGAGISAEEANALIVRMNAILVPEPKIIRPSGR